MSVGDELPDFSTNYADAFFGVDAGPGSGGGGRAAAPAAATALDAAATPAPAFPAVDPAALFRGVDLAVAAAAYSGQQQALVGRTPAATAASLAIPASGSTPPPRPKELSPPRARAVADTAAGGPQRSPRPPTTPPAADKAGGPSGSANKTAPKTARTSEQAHAALRVARSLRGQCADSWQWRPPTATAAHHWMDENKSFKFSVWCFSILCLKKISIQSLVFRVEGLVFSVQCTMDPGQCS